MDIPALENKALTLPEKQPFEQTFLGDIKATTKEVVMADVLAYFFDSRKPHGLKDLFLQALLSTPMYALREKNLPVALPEAIQKMKGSLNIEEVETEVLTTKKNRIDILIKTDKLVVAIEFKINHVLDNPLDDYIHFVNEEFPKHEKLFIVLAPYWKEPATKADKDGQFKQVIIRHFLEKVEELSIKSEYEISEQSAHYHFFQDFLKANRNNSRRIKLVNEFSEKYDDDVKRRELDDLIESLDKLKKQNILGQYSTLKQSYHQRILPVKNFLREKAKEVNKLKAMKDYSIWGYSDKMCTVIGRDLKDDYAIKVRLSLKGWTIEKWKGSKHLETATKNKIYGNYFSMPEKIAEEVKAFEKREGVD